MQLKILYIEYLRLQAIIGAYAIQIPGSTHRLLIVGDACDSDLCIFIIFENKL